MAVTATTSYWVRVTNDCGNSAVSSLLTVAPCVLPAIITQPVDQTIQSGQSATLSVVVAGTKGKLFELTSKATGAEPAQQQQAGKCRKAAADDEAEIWLNGKRIGEVKGWNNAARLNLRQIKRGENVIAIRGLSGTGDAAGRRAD